MKKLFNWSFRLLRRNPSIKNWIPAFAGMTAFRHSGPRAGIQFFAVLVFIIGSALRFTAVNWDSYQAFHPDERNIAWAVTRIHFFDQMDPKFFAYGGLPVYLYRAIGEIIVAITKDTNWLFDWGHIAVIGRYVSSTISSISIILIYLVAASYFSKVTGLLSAFFLAFSPWAIREAHFATTETMLVFFLLLLLWVNSKHEARISNLFQRHSALLSGIILGLAAAAKTTSLLFALIPLTALVLPLTFFQRPLKKSQSIQHIILYLFLLTATAGTIFFLFSPYTILDWQHFTESMRYESGVALGRFTVPYTLQFLGTIPYLYQLQTMVWQSGPVAVIGTIGLVILIIHSMRHLGFFRHPGLVYPESFQRDPGSIFFFVDSGSGAGMTRKSMWLFLIFPVVYFFWQGNWFAKFSRYNVPLLPFLTIAAAWVFVSLWKFFKKSSPLFFICRICIFVGFVGFHAWWGLANWTIYLRPQTRVEASRWIYQNIAPNAIIYTEHWNDGLPGTVPHVTAKPFNRELLNVYDDDNDAKLDMYQDKVTKGTYIILSTRRIWATMPKLTKKYPYTSRFYRRLFDGSLGYQEVATFTSYPSLFGITVNDDAAEESIQVFDHPTVKIFQHITPLSREEIRSRLIAE